MAKKYVFARGVKLNGVEFSRKAEIKEGDLTPGEIAHFMRSGHLVEVEKRSRTKPEPEKIPAVVEEV